MMTRGLWQPQVAHPTPEARAGRGKERVMRVAALLSSRKIFPRGPSSYISLARTGSHAPRPANHSKGTDCHGACGAMVSNSQCASSLVKPGLLTKWTGDHCYRKDQHNFCHIILPLEHLLVEDSELK